MKTINNKVLVLVASIALALACTVGATLAWLTASTDTVTNTFTTSDIGVTLKETKTDFKMIPGYTIAKDPKVTVTTGSEECWLFVKVEKSANFDTYLTYKIADGWEEGTGTGTGEGKNGVPVGVYYRKVTTSSIGTEFSVLKNDQVSVKDTVTKTDMTAAGTNKPTLKFTAYASQLYKSAGTEFTPAEAWSNANPTT